jgi:7-cyano-7-deazaguanine synthase in queuosine biosynthesis
MILTDQHGQTVDFKIPVKYKKILVNVSGGADSALLLYLIVKYVQNNIKDAEVNVMTLANRAKADWNARKAADVIHYVITRTNFQNFNMHYTFYRDEQEMHYFEETQKDLFEQNKFDFFAHGTTANPQGDVFVSNIDNTIVNLKDNALSDRDPRNYNFIDEHEHNGKKFAVMNPWYNVDKRFIAEQYDKFNLRKDLLPLTRSCEVRPRHLGISDKVYGKDFENTPCGKCWWCLERKWAFGYF